MAYNPEFTLRDLYDTNLPTSSLPPETLNLMTSVLPLNDRMAKTLTERPLWQRANTPEWLHWALETELAELMEAKGKNVLQEIADCIILTNHHEVITGTPWPITVATNPLFANAWILMTQLVEDNHFDPPEEIETKNGRNDYKYPPDKFQDPYANYDLTTERCAEEYNLWGGDSKFYAEAERVRCINGVWQLPTFLDIPQTTSNR